MRLLAAALILLPSSLMAEVPSEVMRQSWNVCKITVPPLPGQKYGKRGSGCYIGSNIIVSCEHVVQGHKTTTCTFQLVGDKTETISATVVGVDSEWDVSVLKLERTPAVAPGARLASCTPSVGEKAYASGYSANRLLWLPGIVQRGDKPGQWRISNAANPGDSGGATFNAAGEFVAPLWGMNSRNHRTATQTIANDNTKTRGLLRKRLGPQFCRPGQNCPPSSPPGGASPGRRPEEPDWDVPPIEPPEVPVGPTMEQFAQLADQVGEIRDHVDGLGSNVEGLLGDITSISSNQTTMKGDITTTKTDLHKTITESNTSITERLKQFATADQLGQFATQDQLKGVQADGESARQTVLGVVDGKIKEAAWLKFGSTVAASLGFGGPVGAGIALAGFWMRRRRESQHPAQPQPGTRDPVQTQQPDTYIVDAPQQPARRQIETQIVNVESDGWQRANELARQQTARRYPGAQEILETQSSLARQFYAGDVS